MHRAPLRHTGLCVCSYTTYIHVRLPSKRTVLMARAPLAKLQQAKCSYIHVYYAVLEFALLGGCQYRQLRTVNNVPFCAGCAAKYAVVVGNWETCFRIIFVH